MAWYSVRPFELLHKNPQLFESVRNLVVDAQLQAHPGELASDVFVLRANSEDEDSVYIHVGEFTPHAIERFTIRLLRAHIGNGGAGIKRRGVAQGYEQGLLGAQQNAVMEQALNLMRETTQAMLADVEADVDADGDDDMDWGLQAHNFFLAMAPPFVHFAPQVVFEAVDEHQIPPAA